MPAQISEEQKLKELFEATPELKELVEAIPNSYDGLVIAACHVARKTGKAQEMIDYIQENNPTPSDLVLFFGTVDDSIPKPFEA